MRMVNAQMASSVSTASTQNSRNVVSVAMMKTALVRHSASNLLALSVLMMLIALILTMAKCVSKENANSAMNQSTSVRPTNRDVTTA